MNDDQHSNEQTHTITSSRRLWTAVILGSLSAFGPLSLDMYLPSLPKLAADLQTSTSLTQLSLTACLIGLALGQLFAGPLSDVRGRRVPLLIGLIGYTVSSLLCAFAPSIWTFILLRFIQGLAGSAGIVIARAVVRDLYSGTELTKFFSLLMLVNGVAPIASPIAGAQLLHVTSWRGIFLVLAVIGVLMLLGVLLGLPETLPAARRAKGGMMNTLSTFARLARNSKFIGYALSQGLVLGAMFAYISGSPFVLQDIFGVSAQLFSLCFAINGFGIILASQLAGRLAGRLNETTLLLGGLCLAALGGVMLLLMILIGAGLPAILIFLFIIVSCVGLVSTLSVSLAMRDQGQSAGSASALLGVLTFLLGSLVAPLAGLGGSLTAVPMGIIIATMEVGALFIFAKLVLAASRRTAADKS